MENRIFIGDIEMVSPFKRICYVAMILGFYPIDYTNDAVDNNIIYGEKLKDLKHRLTYLQCMRILLSTGIKDLSIMDKLFVEKNWKSLFDEIDNYNIDMGKVDSGLWRYFRSYSLESSGIGFHSKDVQHRLYLNINLEYRAYFAKTFIEHCVKEKISYYFKVLAQKGQTDTIVIYVDNDENLTSTVNVINDIFSNEKVWTKVTKEPAPHLYRINDFIGYGFEPPLIDGHKLSYTELMKECERSANDEIIKLRNKVLSDFKNGNIYPTNDSRILIPSKNEINILINSNSTQKFEIFKKYFQYILEIYGNEIMKILNKIEETRNNKLNTEHSVIKK